MQLNQSLDSWQPLALLDGQFINNCDALERRDGALAGRVRRHVATGRYVLCRRQERLVVARCGGGGAAQEIAPSVNPAASREALRRIYPNQVCHEPAMIAGIDQGWLWQMLHQMPCNVPAMPGHRPPVFLLCGAMEGLWLAMHLHDWVQLLGDERVHLFVGEDAVEQFRTTLINRPNLPWPKFALTLEAGLWPEGQNIDSLRATVNQTLSARLQEHMLGVRQLDAAFNPVEAARRLRSGQKLRILGITSRYTTFLQYSMRDWLGGFEAMGHDTHLLMEPSDHEVSNNLATARACDDFRPDLVLLIDHYRDEFTGLPRNIPCAMWIQDLMPHLLKAEAGRAQAPHDYVLGYGRPIFAGRHAYPYERFMPSMLGVNDERFNQESVSREQLSQYECDLSFVSHASTPAQVLLQERLEQTPEDSQRVLRNIFERLEGVYDGGSCVAEPLAMEMIIDQSLRELGVEAPAASRAGLSWIFVNQINNAMFRHQALHWAAELGLDLRLYGRGWEKHPTLGRFARGIADNRGQLAAIHQASRINLHITPHGAVHQRVLDGLCAGGFFLIRHRPGDAAAVHYRPIAEWARQAGITSDGEFRTRAPSGVWRMVQEAQRMRGLDLFHLEHSFMEELNLLADSEYTLAGATLWDEYFDVSFDCREQLGQRVGQYLNDEPKRRQTMEAMRRPVLAKLTYRHIGQRLLEFIAGDLERQAAVKRAA